MDHPVTGVHKYKNLIPWLDAKLTIFIYKIIIVAKLISENRMISGKIF
jgi:hypothetical protein